MFLPATEEPAAAVVSAAVVSAAASVFASAVVSVFAAAVVVSTGSELHPTRDPPIAIAIITAATFFIIETLLE
jgi:hypothetical protein